MVLGAWLFRNKSPHQAGKWFRSGQLFAAGAYSLGHGGNDAQKTMGIITGLLYANGYLQGEFHVPLWIVLSCHLAMGLGTLFGGWRIVRTMGMGITRIRPTGAFAAQTSGAAMLFLATHLGIPVSTTHTITGAIVGVGLSRRVSAVRWGIAGRIVWAWVLTIPVSGLIAALFWRLGRAFMG
jgi:PiT family inorganic phosphate transporter